MILISQIYLHYFSSWIKVCVLLSKEISSNGMQVAKLKTKFPGFVLHLESPLGAATSTVCVCLNVTWQKIGFCIQESCILCSAFYSNLMCDSMFSDILNFCSLWNMKNNICLETFFCEWTEWYVSMQKLKVSKNQDYHQESSIFLITNEIIFLICFSSELEYSLFSQESKENKIQNLLSFPLSALFHISSSFIQIISISYLFLNYY